MKTIQLNITKNRKPRQILKTLRDKKLSRGDRLMITKKDEEQSLQMVFIVVLILIIWYFTNETKKKNSFGDEVEDMLFDKNISPDVLERQIEKEYGVKVEMENAETEEKMWRNFSGQNFLKGYGSNEPEYTLADVKEPNPAYKRWKKEK
ncbi:MAG: hypothetical protein ABI855_12065 [Bacteroidota bacterium]